MTAASHRVEVQLIATVAVVILLAGCSNPRKNPRGNEGPDNPPPTNIETVRLTPGFEIDDKYRTTRVLKVEEFTSTERYVTTSTEETLTRVKRVDDSGRPIIVERAWENSVTTLVKGFGKGETRAGELDGVTLRLTQRPDHCEAQVLAGDLDVRGRQLFIEGLDTGLLPLDPIKRGDHWQLGSARLRAFEGFIKAFDFEVESNRMDCNVSELDTSRAVISINWRISGLMSGRTAVLEFNGELVHDRELNMNTGFTLKGGRQGEQGDSSIIEISIKRRKVTSWLDLEG
ncbi:MAG: hypothetical protein ACYTDT_00400 [Planctomycetota bacterium]|jgi:hypothetical protein